MHPKARGPTSWGLPFPTEKSPPLCLGRGPTAMSQTKLIQPMALGAHAARDGFVPQHKLVSFLQTRRT